MIRAASLLKEVFRKPDTINLPASVTRAIETIRVALEIIHGVELNYVGELVILPGDIHEQSKATVRYVTFNTSFTGRIPGSPVSNVRRLMALTNLERVDKVWMLQSAELRIIDPQDMCFVEDSDGSRWYHVRHAMEHPFDTRLYIAKQTKEDSEKNDGGWVNPKVWRGHGIADRHESVMYGRGKNAEVPNTQPE